MVAAVHAAVARAAGVQVEELSPADALYDDLGTDSLTVMELLSALEDDLGIALPPGTEFAAGIRTVGDVVEAFRSRAA